MQLFECIEDNDLAHLQQQGNHGAVNIIINGLQKYKLELALESLKGMPPEEYAKVQGKAALIDEILTLVKPE